MPKDVTERRERAHDLLVIEGRGYEETVARLTEEFDVAEPTVRDDLRNMSEWVGDLLRPDPTGASRLLELREARERLYDMAREAREAGDRDLERKILEGVRRSITADLQLTESLGLTEPPGEIEAPEPREGEEHPTSDETADVAERDPAVLSASR